MGKTKIFIGLLMAIIMVAGGICSILPAFGKDSPAGVKKKPETVNSGISPIIVSPVVNENDSTIGGVEASEASEAGNTGQEKSTGTPSKPATIPKISHKPRLVWQADDCGCTPIQPERKMGLTKITYGFYHGQMKVQENKKKNIAVAKIKFSRLNRIGYASLVYDMEKGFLNDEDWENNGFVKDARRYNSRVDLVVAFSKDTKALFLEKSKPRTLAREIEGLIKKHGVSGVTIDFRNTSELNPESVYSFVSVLREKLTIINKQLYLNLFFEFDKTAKDGGFSTLSLDQIGNMMDLMDLFLVMMPRTNGKKDPAEPDSSFLALSDRLDLYGIKTKDNGLKDKTLPVFFTDNEKNETFFKQILSVGYGGVGLWPDNSLADQETQFIGLAFNSYLLRAQMDYIKRILYKFCPDCCKWICPNREVLKVVFLIFGAALFLYCILAFFFCGLRSFAATHVIWFVGIVLGVLGLGAGLILCVPSWQGKRTMSIIILVLMGVAYIIREFIRKRQEAKFP